jgi:hypothetical protein
MEVTALSTGCQFPNQSPRGARGARVTSLREHCDGYRGARGARVTSLREHCDGYSRNGQTPPSHGLDVKSLANRLTDCSSMPQLLSLLEMV